MNAGLIQGQEKEKDRKPSSPRPRSTKKLQGKVPQKSTEDRETLIDTFLGKAKNLYDEKIYDEDARNEALGKLFNAYKQLGSDTEKRGKGAKKNNECVLLNIAQKRLVDKGEWRLNHLEDFLKRLLSKWPDLVTEKGDAPPLLWGLHHQDQVLVDSILQMKNLSGALEQVWGHGSENCLHIAIRAGSPKHQIEHLTCRLRAHYPDGFLKPNSTGNTPLHVLVGRMGDEMEPNNLKYIKEAADYYANNPVTAVDGEGDDPETDENDDYLTEDEGSEETEAEGEEDVGPAEDEIEEEQADGAKEEENHTKLEPLSRCNIIKKMIDKIDKQKHGTNALLTIKNEKKRTPYQERLEKLKEKLKSKEKSKLYPWFEQLDNSIRQEEIFWEIVAKDPIANVIREYCMRELPTTEIVKCLYTPDTERQIDFDLAGLPNPSISASFLDGLKLQLRFESILKYVALPKLMVEQSAGPVNQRSRSAMKHKSLKNLSDIFQWLKENGVKKIIRVSVFDYGDHPHPDSAIEEDLKSLEVEIWDWKKVDLCSDVISNSSASIREISLYFSGNPAVLKGWGSAQGFADREKFPNLKKIDLFVKKDDQNKMLGKLVHDFRDELNGTRHIKQQASGLIKSLERLYTIQKDDTLADNLDQLKNRLGPFLSQQKIQEACGIPVHPHYQEGDFTYATDFIGAEEIKQEEVPWLAAIEKFKLFLRNIKSPASKVKIAIIDDGIDMSKFSQRTIELGKSFSPYLNSKDFMRSYFVPSGAHGTQMATIIAKICPSPKLFIARLDEHEAVEGYGTRFTPSSAAEAIEWACECNVDIINMSWTVESHGPKSEDIDKLEKAVRTAQGKGILMFCSTSDQGASAGDKSCPGCWDACIKIGGADHHGERLIWVDSTVPYLFPGKRIPFLNDDGKTYHYESGSSLATACASGLAGLLLYCERVLEKNDPKASLKNKDNMEQMLKRLQLGNGRKFVDVKAKIITRFLEKLKTLNDEDVKAVDIDKLDWDMYCKEALAHVIAYQ